MYLELPGHRTMKRVSGALVIMLLRFLSGECDDTKCVDAGEERKESDDLLKVELLLSASVCLGDG
jgi:hypothetical protein